MATARPALSALPDIGFWKLCGSGTGEGFTPLPNTKVWAILATWPDAETARRRLAETPVFQRWRARADDSWTVLLAPTGARGAWAGASPFTPSQAPTGGPVAVLTRATLKPRILARFWRRVPDVSRRIGADPNVMFKIGIGEVPWLHQVTFSIWPDTESLTAFARQDGPHAQAIRAVRKGRWFREELYARFNILEAGPRWDGQPMSVLAEGAAP
ncbi:MAG: spheroidene monooxygenase [Silicimonas sp.]|nr:spheroidene monooxygenase [Silicimonas sp.]